jgi:hypothetical protein
VHEKPLLFAIRDAKQSEDRSSGIGRFTNANAMQAKYPL